ncbi:Uncharacterised protein [Achromobacter xylosoxidans]|uniref:hypothetical protein n=1 Tax=Achromobacter TaxID=222 RepID=UPI0006BEFD8D|nr:MULTISPECIES: hypothetical protein [Achromobacter]WNO49119.1 hypothetical protein [Achromobacter phage CF418P1]CUI37975.1 Uncharacterised protein [Achromobacter xylosoxidans]CUR74774.1 hypothetical protein BN2905_36520 [Achromobacter xylosoxidans]
MARATGDKNLSAREQRKDAQIAELKKRIEAEKAATKVKVARIKELNEKVRDLSAENKTLKKKKAA